MNMGRFCRSVALALPLSALSSFAQGAVTRTDLSFAEYQEFGANAAFSAVVSLSRDGNASCSGTLIAARTILTAAHCVSDLYLDSSGKPAYDLYSPSSLTASFALSSMSHATSPSELSSVFEVTGIDVNPDYLRRFGADANSAAVADMAILRLSDRSLIGTALPSVAPISIYSGPVSSDLLDEAYYAGVGFGHWQPAFTGVSIRDAGIVAGGYPEEAPGLKHAWTQDVSELGSGGRYFVTESAALGETDYAELAAGFPDAVAGGNALLGLADLGDSGGPLLAYIGSKFQIVGVMSRAATADPRLLGFRVVPPYDPRYSEDQYRFMAYDGGPADKTPLYSSLEFEVSGPDGTRIVKYSPTAVIGGSRLEPCELQIIGPDGGACSSIGDSHMVYASAIAELDWIKKSTVGLRDTTTSKAEPVSRLPLNPFVDYHLALSSSLTMGGSFPSACGLVDIGLDYRLTSGSATVSFMTRGVTIGSFSLLGSGKVGSTVDLFALGGCGVATSERSSTTAPYTIEFTLTPDSSLEIDNLRFGDNFGSDFSFGLFPFHLADTDVVTLIEGDLTTAAEAVPEPATWAMMIGGFAFTGAALRRRKMSVVFAVRI